MLLFLLLLLLLLVLVLVLVSAGHWLLHAPLPPSIVFLRFKFVNKAVKLVSDRAVDQITCTKSKVPAVVDAAEIDTASDLDLDHAPDSGSKPHPNYCISMRLAELCTMWLVDMNGWILSSSSTRAAEAT